MTYVGYDSMTIATALETALEGRALMYQASLEHMRNRPPYQSELDGLEIRKTFTEVAFSISAEYGGDWFPERLADLPAWSIALLKRVPAKYRASATLEVTGSEYDTRLEVSYERPETNKEWKARKADVARRQALAVTRQEETDRKEFERLQAKFEAGA